MIFIIAHVTGLLVLAFFVLFAAGKADGFVRLLGAVLGIWLLVLALAVIALCFAGPMLGWKMPGMDMLSWHRGWMHRGPAPQQSMPVQPPTPASPKGPAPAKSGGH